MKRAFWLLFITHFITRLLFSFWVGFYNNYQLQTDSIWLVNISDRVLKGDFNFELQRFIVSPLFPIICGVFKILFGVYWDSGLIFFQLIISSFSGAYIFLIAFLLFRNKKIAFLSSLIFAFFPFTMCFVNTFSQECLFQSLLIFTIYFLLKSINDKKLKDLILSAILFSLCYLTKSHILIFSIFIPVLYFQNFGFSKKAFFYSFLFAFIALLFSLPYGLYEYKKNNTYVISSNGSGFQFYLGNTEVGYRTIVDVPDKNSDDYLKIKNIEPGYFNGSQAIFDTIISAPQNIKQELFANEAFKWIKNNKAKFIKLKLYDLFFFLMPGVSFRHYSFSFWLFSFLFSFPIYVLAYIVIVKGIKNNYVNNSVIFYLFFTMILFSLIWYVQNRFRTITIEPFYIIYSSPLLLEIINKIPFTKNIFLRISSFYLRSIEF